MTLFNLKKRHHLCCRAQISESLFIDEIQFVRKVENPDLHGDFITFYEVLNGLLRHKNIDTYVTRSNSKLNSCQIEPSHLMENIIYNELIVRGFSVDVKIIEINKVKLEVDFTESSGNRKFYIQSAYTMDSEEKDCAEKIHDSF